MFTSVSDVTPGTEATGPVPLPLAGGMR
jgi:hypothetical protein